MKKYLAGFLMLGVLFFSGALPSKVNAGPLTTSQQNSIIIMLQNAGATPQAIAQVQAAFGMMPTSSAGTSGTTSTTGGGTTTTTTTVSTGGTVLPCTNNAAYSSTTGLPCVNYVAPTTPQTGGPLYPPTTTPTTPTTGGPLFPPTTPNTPSTPSNCISNQTFVTPYVVINGQQVQCVKACPMLTASNMSTNYWNVTTSSLCPVYTPPPVVTSITVIHPNGGEVLTQGSTTAVKWESSNIPSTNTDVMIKLYYYDANGTLVTTSVLAENQTNDGGVEVTLPSTLPVGAMWGNYFKVSVSSQGVSDMSDAMFTIE